MVSRDSKRCSLHQLISHHCHFQKPLNQRLRFVHLLTASQKLDGGIWVHSGATVLDLHIVLGFGHSFPFLLQPEDVHQRLQSVQSKMIQLSKSLFFNPILAGYLTF